jgi:hypothetical protein
MMDATADRETGSRRGIGGKVIEMGNLSDKPGRYWSAKPTLTHDVSKEGHGKL